MYKYLNKCIPLCVFVNLSFLLIIFQAIYLELNFDIFKGCFEMLLIKKFSKLEIHSIYQDDKYRFKPWYLPVVGKT